MLEILAPSFETLFLAVSLHFGPAVECSHFRALSAPPPAGTNSYKAVLPQFALYVPAVISKYLADEVACEDGNLIAAVHAAAPDGQQLPTLASSPLPAAKSLSVLANEEVLLLLCACTETFCFSSWRTIQQDR